MQKKKMINTNASMFRFALWGVVETNATSSNDSRSRSTHHEIDDRSMIASSFVRSICSSNKTGERFFLLFIFFVYTLLSYLFVNKELAMRGYKDAFIIGLYLLHTRPISVIDTFKRLSSFVVQSVQ